MDFAQVLPRLFVGSCPASSEDLDHLKTDYGVTAVLNLQTDQDFDYCDLDFHRLEAHCHDLDITLRRIPIRDFDGADLRRNLAKGVQALDELLREGHTVYAHCNVGAGRSPSVVIAYLHWQQRWTLDDAVEYVTKCRSCSPNIEAILLAGDDRTARPTVPIDVA